MKPSLVLAACCKVDVINGALGLDLTAINLQSVTQKLGAQWQQTGGAVSQMVKYATQSSVSFLSTLGSIAMVPVVAFYMLRDFDLVLALSLIHI